MPAAAPLHDRKTLYLVDGHAQFFRAYHAIRTGMTSPVTKEPTNLTFGFVGMLLKVLREYKPDYFAVVIDAAGDRETFRSEIYPEYKATRKETPDDFHPQVERCLSVMKQMGVPVVAELGVEADDVIATIVRRLRREHPDLHIRIVSKDKDLAQLLDDHVELFDVHKDQAVTAAEVFGVEGVEPKHVIEMLTLMGDNIDNVPGVEGIGPKTAAQLVLQYGTVENLLQHLDEIKGKRRENIEAARTLLPMTRQLVSLKDDVPLDFDLECAKCCPTDLLVDELIATFRELGFNRYQDELKAVAGGRADGGDRQAVVATAAAAAHTVGARQFRREFAEGLFAGFEELESLPTASTTPRVAGEYICIRTQSDLEALIESIRKKGEFAIDTETDSLNPLDANLCGLSIAVEPGKAYYVPVRSPECDSHMNTIQALDRLRSLLEDVSIKKIGHNLKFDMNVLRKHGVKLRGHVTDTMIASYVIDSTRSSHGLDVLALALLNHTNIPITDLIGSGRKQRTFDEAPLDLATCYAAEDADITLRLRDEMMPQLRAMKLVELYENVEMPLVDVLAEIEWNGIRVDPDELDRQRLKLEDRVKTLRSELQDIAPFPFNPDSPKQLAAVLFNKPDRDPPGLGLRPLRRGKTGPSTDQEVLERLAADPNIESPIPQLIVEYRQLTKLVNTYLLSLKEAINSKTGRIHASFHQTVAVTGRLSSSDPNLQNIPIRTDIGREIRRAFVAERSQESWLTTSNPNSTIQNPQSRGPNVLITADYSQIELRLLAHLSEDPALIEAFEKGQDIHAKVASDVFGVKPEDVTLPQRIAAKMVNFGIVYGITPSGLSRRLRRAGSETSFGEAAKIISDYKARYSKIAEFLDQCIQSAITRGYVETISGRRRPITQIHARDPQTRALGERLAINSVVQGSAADLIKIAMIDIYRALIAAREVEAATPMQGNASAFDDDVRDALARTRMILQIHDELVFETPESLAEPVAAFVKERMRNAMKLRVPLDVGVAWSGNWIDAK